MKKIFSLVAVAGLLVACQAEQIDTAFEVANAEVVITLKAFDVKTPSTEIASGVTYASTAGTVSGNTITIVGNKSVKEQEITVTPTYEGKEYTSQAITIAGVLGGGKANYSMTFIVGTPVSEYDIELVKVDEDVTVEVKGAEQATHSHANNLWFANESEFYLTPTFTYDVVSGSTAAYDSTPAVGFEAVCDAYVNAFNQGITVEQDEYVFPVSAWSWYRVFATYTTTVTNYEVTADGEVVGAFTVTSASSTQIEYEEIANPNGHGHYHYGHGSHDVHGYSANAGGGIIYAE